MVNVSAPKNSKPKSVVSKSAIIKKRTHLYLNDKFITCLTITSPLENLSVLYLHNNNILKIENLNSAVNLNSLYLQKNKISKIENLGCLKNLKKLYIGHNEISVVEGLENLSNLEELHIEKQRLNGDPLCFDPRTVISIANSLLVLNISQNNIASIAHLSPLKCIKVLNAGRNKLSDIGEVCDTLRNWYYLYDATLTGNSIAKQHRYRENLIANTFRLSVLDSKDVSETTRCFIKRFEEEKVNQTSKHSINLAEKLPTLPKHYPLPIQKAVSHSILMDAKPCFDDTTLSCDVDDIYLPWKANCPTKMKRTASNIINLPTNKTPKELEDERKNLVESICKRRRQELFEIVSKENEIHGPDKRLDVNELTTVYEDSCTSSESEDCNSSNTINFRTFTVREKQKVIEDCKIISRAKARTALRVLESNIKYSKEKLTNEKKRLNMLEKHCSKRIHWQDEREPTWDSSMYIIKVIRTCILSNNWKNVTYLLLMLLKYKKRCVSYVKQVALLNLTKNPLDYNGEILEELHKLSRVSATK